jgi:hypothetical protein
VLKSREEWLDLLAKRLPLLLPVAHSVMKDWNIPTLRNELAMSVIRSSEHNVSNEHLLATYLPVWRRQRRSVRRPGQR